MGIMRRIQKIVISLNPFDNSVDNLGGTGEVHNISDQDGALESTYFEETHNLHCGCFGQPGGRCSECGVISCIRCHRHCGGSDNQAYLGCGRPLCREHSYYMMFEGGISIPFCRYCYDEVSRKNNRVKVARFLLSPFVERKIRDEQRKSVQRY